MEGKGLGRHINMVRKDRRTGFRNCSISTLLTSGRLKTNALKISPDYLLRDAPEDNEVSKIWELAELWESTSPGQQEIAAAMIRAVLERREN